MASHTQSVRTRHTKPTMRVYAKDHGSSETLERTPGRFRVRCESLGAGRWRVGTCFGNPSRRRSKTHGDDEHGSVSPQKPSAPGTYADRASLRNALLQCCYSTSNFGTSGENSQDANDHDRM